MQRVYKEVSTLDRRCYSRFLMSEDLLMEHAALGLKRHIDKQCDKNKSVLIIAGPGNNGADGIALARLLHGEFNVALYLPFGAKSQMAKIQLARAMAVGVAVVKELQKADIVVDALFGTGLSGSLNEEAIRLIELLNTQDGYRIACDIPSGLDTMGRPSPVAFRADVTITMGALKLSLFSDEAKEYVGDIEVANLGVARDIYEQESNIMLLERSDLKLPFRSKKATHKGDFGHLCVVAGEKEGAAVMAASAALRFGAGLVSVAANQKIALPCELMQTSHLPSTATAIAVGMGLGNEYSDDELREILFCADVGLVVDADLFYRPMVLELLARNRLVLTPHPKEFASLLKLTGLANVDAKEVQKSRFELAELFGRSFKDIVLVLKGANTLIVQNDRLYINPHGTNALSKGGSGDVLTGLIAALMAQGFEPLDAAISGSLAQTFAAQKVAKNNYALIPSDLIGALGCL